MAAMFGRAAIAVASIALLGPCGKDESKTAPSASASVAAPTTTPAATSAAPPASTAATTANAAAAPPPGSPPKDDSYERVQVEGVTVPVIKVMNQGSIVLVDTDGVKPRTWEEEYKRKSDKLLPGQYDLHKTDKNKNGKFDDDEVDKVGLWV